MSSQKKTRSKTPVNSGSARGRRKRRSSGKPRIPWVAIFWLAFVILIFGLFFLNRDTIRNSIGIIAGSFSPNNAPVTDPVERIFTTPSPPIVETEVPPAQSDDTAQDTQIELPQAELRERALYFTQVDRDGIILRIRVERNLPLTSSPLTDVLQALIAGPTAEESRRGLISLLPEGTTLLSASVRDNTAYINFNEDFQYNTYGVEGYAGQLRQVIYTATEFPNVRDVQILIEGRQVSYLGEGIWIGSPLNREMF